MRSTAVGYNFACDCAPRLRAPQSAPRRLFLVSRSPHRSAVAFAFCAQGARRRHRAAPRDRDAPGRIVRRAVSQNCNAESPFVGCAARGGALVDNVVDSRCSERSSFGEARLDGCFCTRFAPGSCGPKKACTGPPELLCLVLKTGCDTTYSRFEGKPPLGAVAGAGWRAGTSDAGFRGPPPREPRLLRPARSTPGERVGRTTANIEQEFHSCASPPLRAPPPQRHRAS
jgi:hypothetical protein